MQFPPITASEAQQPRRLNPQQQLWELIDPTQQKALALILQHLKKSAQEDLCLGLVAYLRWGIVRPYDNPLLSVLYDSLIPLVTRQPADSKNP